MENRKNNCQSRQFARKRPAESDKTGRLPLVDVLLPTFNRPRRFSEALASVLKQTHTNLRVIIVNDGGRDVSQIVNAYNDSRVIFINRKENCGKAYSLNEALTYAEGKYIAYLDDDDLYYPEHIETLVNALETQPQFGAAYTDLYQVHSRLTPDGDRIILSKVLEVSRDFDRFVILYFNNVFHVSLMHRTGLLEKTGLYNEDLGVLIDWDMTRRLAFYTDFCHICQITGEYNTTEGESDRISVRQRLDKQNYVSNALKIRTTRPPKPWPKIKDLSIILLATRPDNDLAVTLGRIWQHTFYPYKLYLPMFRPWLEKINTEMPNLVLVPVDYQAGETELLDAVLPQCQGEYVAVVPSSFDVRKFWLEDSLYALINNRRRRQAFELEHSNDGLWAAVLERQDLQCARHSFGRLTLRESLEAAEITMNKLLPEQIPFQFDQLLEQAQVHERQGNYQQAAEIFEYIPEHYGNRLVMNALAAQAHFKAENLTRADELINRLNRERPTVDTLLLEAKIRRRQKDFDAALKLLEEARQIIKGKELIWI